MNKYTREQLLELAKLTAEDLEEIERRRRDPNRLGFAYQLAFMRVYNRFPIQRPSFELDHELLTFVGVQLEVWTATVREADALLVYGGVFYLCRWMRNSGLAALLPSLRNTV